MRVLVTGASSLIGRELTEALTRRGDSVVCFQRHPSAIVIGARALVEVLGDVRDSGAVDDAAARCDAVVHLAAKVGVVGRWDEYRSINVDGTANVLAAARRAGIRRFVHVSSPSVAHGGGALIGARADPPVLGRRRAYYAESKAIAENAALAATSDDMAVVVIRPHLVWGPGDTQLVGRIVERARAGRLAVVGSGNALVDTTYIDNAVSALVAALDAVRPGAACAGCAYVIANGEPRPIRDLIAGICAAAGVEFAPRDVPLAAATRVGSVVERVWPALRRSDEPPLTRFLAEQLGTAHWFDPRPAAKDLGWAPKVTIDEGLRRLAAWYASDPEIGR
ncbi:MAG: NAD-dependent epimerase/dehydratase family protein [Ilumatobacteraceae bacterium]